MLASSQREKWKEVKHRGGTRAPSRVFQVAENARSTQHFDDAILHQNEAWQSISTLGISLKRVSGLPECE